MTTVRRLISSSRRSSRRGDDGRLTGGAAQRMFRQRVAAFVAAMLVLGACTGGTGTGDGSSTTEPAAGSTTGGSPGVSGETLVVAVPNLGGEIFAPHLANNERAVLYAVSEPLVRANRETREPEPGLAESWEVSDDLTTWTFHLRPDVPFHNGYGTLTAEDVEFTWSLFLRDEATHSRSSAYSRAVNGDMANFEVVDDLTFRVHGEPNAALPQYLSDSNPMMSVVSKSYVEEVGEEEAWANPVGTGPWRFVEHVPGASVTMEAVTDHYRKSPEFARFELRIIPEETTALAQVQTGDADMATVSLDLVEEARASGINVVSIPNIGMSSFYFGGWYPGSEFYDEDAPWIQADEPEKGLAVRQAMSIAIDRQSIVDDLLLGEGVPAIGPVIYAPGAPFTNPEWEVPEQDLDRARELLAEGGYPDGFEVDFAVLSQTGRAYASFIVEAMAGWWEDIGITVNRNPIQEAEFDEMRENRASAGIMWQYVQPTGSDGVANLIAFSPEDSGAEFFYPPMDELVHEAFVETDVETRNQLVQQVGDLLVENVGPAVGIAAVNSQWILSDDIASWEFIPGSPTVNSMETVVPAP